MSDNQVLVSVAQRQEQMFDELKGQGDKQEEILEEQDSLSQRMKRAEEITEKVHKGKDWTIRTVLLGIGLGLMSIFVSVFDWFKWSHVKTLFGFLK